MVSSKSLPSFFPVKRHARPCLPFRGSLGFRFPTFPVFSDHRYYAWLRLPTVLPGSLRSSLASRHLAVVPGFCIPSEGFVDDGETHRQRQGSFVSRQPSPGNVWQGSSGLSQVPELPLCVHAPLLDPGGVPPRSPCRKKGLLPSDGCNTSAFSPLGWEDYPHGPRLYIFRGSISRPALSLHPASNTPLLECTRVRYGPVGSTLVRSELPYCYYLWRTDWVTSTSFRTSFRVSFPRSGFILARASPWYTILQAVMVTTIESH